MLAKIYDKLKKKKVPVGVHGIVTESKFCDWHLYKIWINCARDGQSERALLWRITLLFRTSFFFYSQKAGTCEVTQKWLEAARSVGRAPPFLALWISTFCSEFLWSQPPYKFLVRYGIKFLYSTLGLSVLGRSDKYA